MFGWSMPDLGGAAKALAHSRLTSMPRVVLFFMTILSQYVFLFAQRGALLARDEEFGLLGPVGPGARIGQVVTKRVQHFQVARHASEGPLGIELVRRLVVVIGVV